jgi:hypothetical protein
MIDTLNFKRRSYILDLDSNTAVISLPLSIPEFRDVFKDYNTEEEGLKALSYVANIAHYGSPGNIIGLTEKELKNDTIENLGLSRNFKETQKIKKAIIKYNALYNKGVFGLFKELHKSFELTRKSINIVNISLADLNANIKKEQQLKTASPDVLMGNIKNVMDAITQVRQITSGLSKDINALKEVEGILLSEQEVNETLYGGGTVPQSSRVKD